MSAPGVEVDVCVTGGGPAGAVAARQLALLGHRVVVVDAGQQHPVGVQHVAAGVDPALRSIGLDAAFDRATFARPEARSVAWDTAPHFEPELRPGRLVDRSCLDRFLLDAATDAGAVVVGPARATRTERFGRGWHIELSGLEPAADRCFVRASVLIDATGHHSGRAVAEDRTSPATLAICGHWRRLTTAVVRVEALNDGWLWGAPAADGSTFVAAFVDRRHIAGKSAAERAERYRAMVASASLFTDLTGDSLEARLAVADASSRLHPHPAEPLVLRIGAAASAVDPLSSQGLQGAIRSALQGAAAATSMLDDPTDTTAPVAFHCSSTRRSHEQHLAFAADAYRRVAAVRATPFWLDRAAMHTDTSTNPAAAPTARPSTAAHNTTLLQWSSGTTWEWTPVIVGGRVAERLALRHPALHEPVAFVGTQELAALHGELPASVDTVRRCHGDAMAAALWHLSQLGIVEPLVLDSDESN